MLVRRRDWPPLRADPLRRACRARAGHCKPHAPVRYHRAVARPRIGRRGVLLPRLRVLRGREVALGPGKVALLEAIGRTGTIAAAARLLRMSYMRAWTLVQNLNSDPDRPMIEMSRGGRSGGAAKLTSFGKKVLGLYQRMERKSASAANLDARKLARLLK